MAFIWIHNTFENTDQCIGNVYHPRGYPTDKNAAIRVMYGIIKGSFTTNTLPSVSVFEYRIRLLQERKFICVPMFSDYGTF